MIQISNLTKSYRDSVAIKDVSFTAQPGRVTGFIGPNGAGKTTTLRILLGLSSPTSGTATIKGSRYRDLQRPLRTIGAMLEGHGALPDRRGVDHLTWIAQSNGISRKRVDAVLDLVGLSNAGRRRVKTYSLGMGQRLAIAAALLGDPEVLVLDEPTNGLDPEGILWIRTLMRDFAQEGRTVLVSSHLMAELSETADDLVMLGRGRVLAAGTVREVTAGYGTLERAFFATIAGGAR